MTSRTKRLVVGFLAVGMIAAAVHAIGRPSVFSSGSYGEAKAAAESSGRLFIVNAYVPWSSACRRMDKETWSDAALTQWIAANAVAVQFNVQQERGLTQKFDIETLPTILVFEDGKEFDRVIGEHSPVEIIDWLEGVARGERMVDQLRRTSDAGGPEGIQRRWNLARMLVRSNELDDATEEYTWLWDNMLKHDTSQVGARLGALAAEMQDLAERHPPARAAFEAIRDRDGAGIVEGAADAACIVDWVNLNRILDEENATVEWFESVYADPGQRHLVAAVDGYLFGILVDRKRWADAGSVLGDPIAYVRRGLEQPTTTLGGRDMPKPLRLTLERVQQQQLSERMSVVYAACLAAGRDVEARRIADILLAERDDGMLRFQLVRAAVSAGAPRQQHMRWMQQAEARGMRDRSLAQDLAQALAN